MRSPTALCRLGAESNVRSIEPSRRCAWDSETSAPERPFTAKDEDLAHALQLPLSIFENPPRRELLELSGSKT